MLQLMKRKYHLIGISQGSDDVKELYIDRGITQSRAALFDDGKLLNLYIENVDFSSINGNIYKGRIENIVSGLNAAFVNIGIGKNAILHFNEEEDIKQFKRGQEIVVQVIREAIGDKGPRISRVISIPGKYIVLLPGDNYIGVSKKIDDFDLRGKIKDVMRKIHEESYGVIVRTEGADISYDELCSDYEDIKSIWKDIEKKVQYIKAPQLLFNSKDFYEFIIREYIKGDIDKIYINREKDFDYIKNRLSNIDKSLVKKLIYEEYNFTLQDRIEKEIEKTKERKISLSCGGYIIIDQTEAFTCVDVNSGNYIGTEDSEETILKVNIEACKKIGSSIRLRNISGIILIDFIDMKDEENRIKVINSLENEFKDDKSKLKVYGFTKLGILETTRAKKGIRLSEFIYNDLENKTLNSYYCLKLIENKCIKNLKHYKKTNFMVNLYHLIYDDALAIIPSFISDMKNIYGISITIKKDDIVKDFMVSS